MVVLVLIAQRKIGKRRAEEQGQTQDATNILGRRTEENVWESLCIPSQMRFLLWCGRTDIIPIRKKFSFLIGKALFSSFFLTGSSKGRKHRAFSLAEALDSCRGQCDRSAPRRFSVLLESISNFFLPSSCAHLADKLSCY